MNSRTDHHLEQTPSLIARARNRSSASYNLLQESPGMTMQTPSILVEQRSPQIMHPDQFSCDYNQGILVQENCNRSSCYGSANRAVVQESSGLLDSGGLFGLVPFLDEQQNKLFHFKRSQVDCGQVRSREIPSPMKSNQSS